MANEFVARNGIIANDNSRISGTLDVSGNISSGGNTVATQSWVTATALSGFATESYVTTAISNLIDSAPGTLNTLNELAAALGDDPNFATTITNSIATKLPLAGGNMTGNINWTSTDKGLVWTMNTDGAYIKFFNTGDGDTNSRLEYATSDNGNEYHRFMVSGVERMAITASGISATGYNKSNWDTAYGWGNHGSAGYVTRATADTLYQPIGSYAAASHTHSATDITSGTLASARLSGTYAINVSGSAATLTTARTIALSGDVTGSASFNGSANVTITATVANNSHTHQAEDVTGGVLGNAGKIGLANHPEGGALFIPSFDNDLAFIQQRGGAVTFYKTTDTTYTAQTLTNSGAVSFDPDVPFNGSTNYAYASLNALSEIVVCDIEMPFTLTYGNTFYIDFGNAVWAAKDVSFYAYQTANNAETTYKLVGGAIVNNTQHLKFTSGSYTHATTGGGTGYGYNRLRVVMTNWTNTGPRIAAIGTRYYNSTSLTQTLLSKAGGTLYGDLSFNDTNTVLKEGSGNAVRIQTGTGYVDIGSMNSGWVHFQADRSVYMWANGGNFSFDADVTPYNNTKSLGTSAARWSTVYGTNGDFSGALYVGTTSVDPSGVSGFAAGRIYESTTGFSAPGIAIGSTTGQHGAIVYGSNTMYFGTENGSDNTLNTRMTLNSSGTLNVTGNITIGGANVATQAWASSQFAASAHTHPISEIDGLQDELDGKQPAGSYLTTSGKAADSNLLDGIDSASFLRSDTNDDLYGTLTIHSGGTNTYGRLRGYPNDNHFIVMRGIVSTGISTLTITPGHRTTFVEHAENNDTTGWYFVSNQPGAYTEVARITRTGITAPGYNKTNWDTAYGWGNHASAGYASSAHTHDDRYYTESEVNTLLAGKQGTGNYLVDTGTSFSGEYPVLVRTSQNVAYSHTGIKFRGSDSALTVAGVVYASGGNSSNWNTAYGWGDHSGRYMTQGLTLSSINTISNGGNRYDPSTNNPTNEHYAVLTYGNGGNVTGQLATHYVSGNLYSRGYNSSWSTWRRYWNDTDFTSTNVSNWNTAYGWGNHSSQGYATQTYVNNAVSSLVNSAPGALDTLNELAAALGNDPNFATTVTNSIAAKVSKSGDTMTGNLTTTGLTVGNGVATGRQPYGPLANANIVLTSSTSDSSGVCGIEFTSGNNYPSDGATIYFENNAGGTGERAKLTLRVDNDQEDFIELRAGKVVINANTYSGGGQNPAVVFQHNDTSIATISSGGGISSYSYQGNANVSGTGNASYHPSGIYSTGTNWLYGTMYLNTNSINDTGNIRTYNSGMGFWARYTNGSDNYSASLFWNTLQLGNNGGNYLYVGKTNTGGYLDIYTNVTGDRSTTGANLAARFHANGHVSINGGSDSGYGLTVSGGIYNDTWYRVTGTAGYYFESYGGGWHMTDGTYLRVYNDKTVYNGGGAFRSDASDQAFQAWGTANWYLIDFGNRSASAGRFGIGLTAGETNRTLSFHIPNHAAYSSSGNVPKFGWYSNGSDELMTLQSATGNLWTKGTITSSGLVTGTDVVSTNGVFASSTDGGRDCYMAIGDDNPTEYGLGYGGTFRFYGDTSQNASILYAGGGTFSGHLAAPAVYGTTTYFGADASHGYAETYGGVSSGLRRISYITMNNGSSNWNDSFYHGIQSTDNAGSYSDSISINSYNDITLRLDTNNNNGASYLRITNNTSSTGGNTIAYIGYDGSTNVSWFSGVVTAGNDFRAPIFYDSQDTGYYVDPNSESKLRKLWINNGGAAGVAWSSGLNMGDGSNYWNFIQDGGIARQRNFGTGGYQWYSSTAAQLMALSNTGDLTITGRITEQSSIRYKTNVQDLGSTLSKVEQLRGVTYTKDGNNQTEIGMIAEEVGKLFPELVSTNEEGLVEALNYSRVTAVLVEAVKELSAKVQAQEIFIDNIVSRLQKLENK